MSSKYRGVFKTKLGNYSVSYKGKSRGTYSSEVLAAKIYDIHLLKERKNIRRANFNMSQKQIDKTWALFENYQEERVKSRERTKAKKPKLQTKIISGITYKSRLGIWSFAFDLPKGKKAKLGGFKTLSKAKAACAKFEFENRHMIAGC